jgi:AcrR family transcriptional regulator
MAKKDAILDASAALMVQIGLDGWSMDQVAATAGCAKGLVVYHYKTKTELLDQTAGRILREIHDRRVTALGAGAAGSALVRLWWAVVDDVRSGRFAAAVALRSVGLPARSDTPDETLRITAARALDVETEVLADPLAIAAVLDGLAFQLLAGRPQAQVREAFDQLWLAMVAPA